MPFRLFEFDRNIPNIVKEAKTNGSGELIFDAKSLKPNTKYDLRIQKRDKPFLRDNVVFTTDKDGKIKTIDNKVLTSPTAGIIEFKEEKINDNRAKMTQAHFKVVDEQGNPVKGVELSANGIRTKITTLKNACSDENGIVTLNLESKVNGVDYIVNISKNDQFNWQFKPDAVTLFVTEEGKVNYTSGEYSTFNNNGENIPVFVVKKIDLNHLKIELQERIKEAEEVLKTREIKDLRDILNSAKEELAKPETLPIYVAGYLNDLTKALEKIKNQPENRTKVAVEPVFVSGDNGPVLDELTFQFINVKHPNEVVEQTTGVAMLGGEELYLNEEYKLTIKDNNSYTFSERLVKAKDLDGYIVLHDAKTNEVIETISVQKKKENSNTQEEQKVKKGTISQMIVSKNGLPALDEMDFEFVNKKNPSDIVIIRSSNALLTGIEVNIGDTYTIKVKNNGNYVYEQDVEIRDMDGDTVAFKVGTDEPVFQLNLVTKA